MKKNCYIKEFKKNIIGSFSSTRISNTPTISPIKYRNNDFEQDLLIMLQREVEDESKYEYKYEDEDELEEEFGLELEDELENEDFFEFESDDFFEEDDF